MIYLIKSFRNLFIFIYQYLKFKIYCDMTSESLTSGARGDYIARQLLGKQVSAATPTVVERQCFLWVLSEAI